MSLTVIDPLHDDKASLIDSVNNYSTSESELSMSSSDQKNETSSASESNSIADIGDTRSLDIQHLPQETSKPATTESLTSSSQKATLPTQDSASVLQSSVEELDQPLPESSSGRSNSLSNQNLPYTITVLDAPLKGKVYLVGTAHFSVESQREVIELIKRVQPNRVVLELCSARIDVLKYNEEYLLKEAKEMNLNKLMQMIKNVGELVQIVFAVKRINHSIHKCDLVTKLIEFCF